MCDTFAALPNATTTGTTLLAKSADTEVNECQALERLPARDWPEGTMIRVTHRLIPQARRTHDCLINKSFWLYGAEIGVNEHGLAIGNEAVFTNNYDKVDGVNLIDLLRIMLERAASAREAIEVTAGLLKEFGQGGNCELRGNSHFDGSFIVADPDEAWILETAGREWAAKRIENVAAISNVLSITDDWDLSSLAGRQGPKIDFRAHFVDMGPSGESGAPERLEVSSGFMKSQAGRIGLRSMSDLLRQCPENWDPAEGEVTTNICMHVGISPGRLWQATGAMIADCGRDGVMAWFTGTSGNDLSVFKPAFPGLDFPDMGPSPKETYDPAALWWRHEHLHRRVMADWPRLAPEIRAEIEALEDGFFAEAAAIRVAPRPQQQAFMIDCWQQAEVLTDRWIKRLESQPVAFANPAYGETWRRLNAAAAFPQVA
ncbi:MAG: C69 family dipeptidase [Pseudomonadota bacterium]